MLCPSGSVLLSQPVLHKQAAQERKGQHITDGFNKMSMARVSVQEYTQKMNSYQLSGRWFTIPQCA